MDAIIRCNNYIYGGFVLSAISLYLYHAHFALLLCLVRPARSAMEGKTKFRVSSGTDV